MHTFCDAEMPSMRHEIGNLKPVTPRASNMHKICSFDQPIKRIIKSLNLPNAFLRAKALEFQSLL